MNDTASPTDPQEYLTGKEHLPVSGEVAMGPLPSNDDPITLDSYDFPEDDDDGVI